MSGYARTDSPIRSGTNHIPYNRRARYIKAPGRIVGVIARQPKGYKPGDFNPLVIYFTVDNFRKDLDIVIDQQNKKPQLPKYSQSLFDSCFKNWGVQNE